MIPLKIFLGSQLPVVAALIGAWLLRRFAGPSRIPLGVVLGGFVGLVGLVVATGGSGGLSGFGLMSVLAAWMFFDFPIVAFLAAGVLLRRRRRLAGAIVGGLALFASAVGVDAFVVEPSRFEVTFTEARHRAIPRRLRLVVLADIQTDRVGAYEARVFDAVRTVKPDVVVYPGDFLQVRRPSLAWDREAPKLRALLKALKPPLGSYAVGGNVDPRRWEALFRGTGVKVVTDRRKTFAIAPGVELTGLPMIQSFDTSLRVERPAPHSFHIVFGHAPDFALAQIDGDLLLAGHIHGGQVRLPGVGPLITFSSVPKQWAAGATKLEGGGTLYVSRGVGLERNQAPRLRFLCRPEIAVIDLVPER